VCVCKARKRDRKYAKPALQSPPEVVPEVTSPPVTDPSVGADVADVVVSDVPVPDPTPAPAPPAPAPKSFAVEVLPLPTLHHSHRLRLPSLSLYDEILNESGPSPKFSSFFLELLKRVNFMLSVCVCVCVSVCSASKILSFWFPKTAVLLP
jgi:hypothetical protein